MEVRHDVSDTETDDAPKRARAGLRTTLNLSPDAVTALHELAAARNTTFAEVIRRALTLEKYLHDATRDGARILVEDPDKTLTRLVIF